MTTQGCRYPPVRRFLIETEAWEEIDAHRGSCQVAQWPQAGRPVSYANLGPRAKCTCLRASNVPEYVHDYLCLLNLAPPGVKAGAAAYAAVIRRCECPRVIVDDGERYMLQVVHDPSCRYFGRRT